jgi:hypothetical protein
MLDINEICYANNRSCITWFVGFRFFDERNCSFEEDFGFEHRLWIYSGRRGVHCWVCDQTARELQSSIRQAIVEHLTVLTVGLVLLFECFMYLCLGRKRFSKTCNTLFSITSITSVKKQNLIY